MYYDNMFVEMVNEYKNLFSKNFNEYNMKCSGNNTSFADWQQKRKEIESKLAKEIDEVKNPIFKLRLNSAIKINIQETTKFDSGCNFEKFCYFIDMLNKEKYSKKIVKYNRNYCSKIIYTIAYEYNRILNFLKSDAIKMSKFNENEFSYAREKAIKIWNEMYKKRLEKIIDSEYAIIIREIESKV